MNSHELAKLLLSRPAKPVSASIDISTCDEDADRRIFTNQLFEVNDLEAEELVLLFDADPKDNYGNDL